MSQTKLGESSVPGDGFTGASSQSDTSSTQLPYHLQQCPDMSVRSKTEPVRQAVGHLFAFAQAHLKDYMSPAKSGSENQYDDSCDSTDGGRSTYTTFDSTASSPYSTYSSTEGSITSRDDLLRRLMPGRSHSSPPAAQLPHGTRAGISDVNAQSERLTVKTYPDPKSQSSSDALPGSWKKPSLGCFGLPSEDSGLEPDVMSDKQQPQSSDGEMLSLPAAVRRPPIDLTSAKKSSAGGEVQGGYLAEFDPELEDKHRCTVCRLALREPVQTKCGHRFCRTCILPVMKAAHPKCPEDKSSISQSGVYPDNFCKKEVLHLKVKCSNYVAGCPWSGQLLDLSEHEMSCQFTLLSCTFQSRGCEELLRRSDIARHKAECPFRDVSCPECGETQPANTLQAHLDQDCLAVEQACVKGCGKKIQRKLLQQHYNEDCPKVDQVCEFADFGCEEKATRDEIEEHCKTAVVKHVGMTCLQLAAQKDEIAVLKSTIDQQDKKIDDLQWKVQVEHEAREVAETRIQQLEERLLNAESAISRLTRLESQVERMIETQSRTRPAASEAVQHLTERVELLENQAATSNAGRATSEQNIDVVKNRLTAIEKQNTVMTRVLNRTDAILAEFDLRMLTQETASYNGILIWKIPDYKRHFEEAANDKKPSLYSPPFYTSRHGYKMCARVYLNGDGVGKHSHMSVFFVIMRGEFDALLQWPFLQKVTLTLLDQSGAKKHVSDTFLPDAMSSSYQRPTTEMNIASGCPRFISLDSLKTAPGFIRENTIFLRVAVETTGLQNY